MGGELARVDAGVVALRDQAEAALERVKNASPEDARMIAADADALIELLKQRGWALGEINTLAEVKIKAERRIGEARFEVIRGVFEEFDWKKAKELLDAGGTVKETARRLGVSPNTIRYYRNRNFERSALGGRGSKAAKSSAVRKFDGQLNLNPARVNECSRLAAIPDQEMEELISAIRGSDRELTTHRVLIDARLRCYDTAERVEQNIYRLKDGRFQIRYQYRGKRHREVLKTTNLETARRTLLERRGVVKEGVRTGTASVDASYSDLRICLDRLDRALPKLSPEAREAAEEAIRHGHRMEDALTKCLKAL